MTHLYLHFAVLNISLHYISEGSIVHFTGHLYIYLVMSYFKIILY